MANSLQVRVTEDGPRNAIVKLVGLVDTSDMNVLRAIPLTGFSQSDDPRRRMNGLRFLCAKYTVTNGLIVVLSWNGNSPEPMCNISESGELDLKPEGGFGPDRTASGYEGSINLATRGFFAGTVYAFTIMLHMTKLTTA